jgi:hypothetical protein
MKSMTSVKNDGRQCNRNQPAAGVKIQSNLKAGIVTLEYLVLGTFLAVKR